MTDANQMAALAGLSTTLTAVAGGAAFFGVLKDDAARQTRLMVNKSLTRNQAKRRVKRRRTCLTLVMASAWVIGIVVGGVTVAVAIVS